MLYLILFCCVTLPCVSAALDYTTVHRGKLTFYGAGADSGGTCMYNNPRHSLGLPTVAVGNFGNAEKCGTCVYITPLGTGLGNSDFPRRPPFIAYVNNQCYECGEDNLDLAESSDGKWDIEWKFIDCPVSGSISLQLKSGSSIWHTEISARNFRNAISKVEYFLGGTWVNLARQPYNYFVLNSRVSLPVNVRLTSFFGNQQTLTLSDANYGVIEPGLISTSIQFPSGSSNPLPPHPPPISPPDVRPPGTCSYGTGTNNWWVEIVAPSSSDSVSVTCSDGAVYSCNYRSDMAKHICNGFPRECFGPRRATVNGRCCPLDGGCSSSSCGSYGTGTNNWWVEIVAPSASDRVSITCSDGATYSCNYRSDMAKHICNGFSRECFGPRRVSVNGRCCPMDASCGSAATSDALITSTNGAGELNYGAVIGIGIAACVVTGLVVGLITLRVIRKRNEEIV